MRRSIEAALVQAAWRMALGRRGPAPGGRQPSDRGRPDAWGADPERFAAHGRRGRMSRTGDGWDHAVVARCFGSFTGERTALGPAATRQDARDEVIDDLERFDHRTRRHSSLGYVRPTDCERVATVASLMVRCYLTTTESAD